MENYVRRQWNPHLLLQKPENNSHELLIVFGLNYEKYMGNKCDFEHRDWQRVLTASMHNLMFL